MKFKQLKDGSYAAYDIYPNFRDRHEIKNDEGEITGVEYGARTVIFGTVIKLRHRGPRTIGWRWFATCHCHDKAGAGRFDLMHRDHDSHGYAKRKAAGDALAEHYNAARRSA